MGDYHRGYNRRDMPPLPTRDMMGSRIYVGKLPSDIREREIEKAFGKYGDIQDISLKGNYCFIQFERSGAAKDAVYELNDRTLFGDRIQVEHARTPKEFAGFRSRNSSGYRSSGGGRYSSSYRDSDRRERERRRERSRSPARSDYRLNVTNLSTRCDRHDLKAVMEKAGEVLYADAHRKKVGEGFVEFSSRKDMERALKKLDGLEINAKPIKLEIEEDKKSRRSRSASRSKSKSRSRSKSKSRSRSKSKSRSRSKSKSRSRSRSASGEKSDKEEGDKSKDEGGDEDNDEAKSDNDEEFDAAERSVKRRKEENGCESDSEKGESASKRSKSESEKTEGELADEETSELNGTHTNSSHDTTEADAEAEGSEETEEVEEVVEEEVEEEVEVDEDEDSRSASDEKGQTEASAEGDEEDV